MWTSLLIGLIISFSFGGILAQSGRVQIYSENTPKNQNDAPVVELSQQASKTSVSEDDVVRVETDLVMIPVQIAERSGKAVSGIRREEFKIFENGIEQEIAYFSNDDQPFTVALVLDMSYSSVFKLKDIQAAAMAFVNQLREHDRVMVVSFDEKARVLCEPTNDRKILKLAIEGSRIESGTSVYSALDLALNEKLARVVGRKAVVLLSDGVDTSSPKVTAEDIVKATASTDSLIYPIYYDTFDDVQKSRRDNAQIVFDEDDRPYTVERPRVKGERERDYEDAREFLRTIADQTGGRVQGVTSKTNLNQAFSKIAEELRKIYSLGYYPSGDRKAGFKYAIKVRVYRPDLKVRARENYTTERKKPRN
jgi:Ca-activated chloride channel homolog